VNRKFRHIALLALAAVMTVGCGSASEEDIDLPVPPQPGQETPIAFSGSLSEEGAVTRTEPAGLETVLPNGDKKFVVWAFKNDASNGRQTVMNGYTVNWVDNTAYTTTSNTHDWEYVNQGTDQTIKYWDWGASAYRFFGYTGNVNVTPPGSTASDPLVLSFTAAAAATNPQSEPVTLPDGPFYSKMWYSTGNPGVYPDRLYGKPVLLEFLKPYVKVRFLFKQSAPDDVYFYKTDIIFAPTDTEKKIATSGTFTVIYPLTGTGSVDTEESWGVTASSIIDALIQADDATSGLPVLDSGKWWIVLPAHNQGSYTLSLKVNGEAKTVVVPAEFMEWKPGYEYTYIFKIIDEGGVVLDNVKVGFSPWTVVEKSKEIYNW